MSDIIAQHREFLKSGGLFEIGKSVLKVSGPDAADFLHRLTTQDIKNMPSGSGAPAAVLQPNGMVISLFDVYNCGNFFLLITDRDRGAAASSFLEKFHFAENLEIKDMSAEFHFLSVQGGTARQAVLDVLARVPERPHEVIGTEDSFVFNENDFYGVGFHLLIKNHRVNNLRSAFNQRGFPTFDVRLWSLLRTESGFFSFGVDLSEKNLILEGALDKFVSRNKGCYPGQEVVERVFTYGNVAKKLVGLRWAQPPSEEPLSAGYLKMLSSPASVRIFAGEKEVGLITSAVRLPWNGEVLARAMVRKPYYEAGEALTVEGIDAPAIVDRLPHSFDIRRELSAVDSV